ncbi:1-(5-phosphoribosyl)-5-[(5-phosphoribosylamino)methylideneamino]imidazole-4-carboxamide isomerase [Paraflavitalea sp. CAU 1676]|uniref:1-(5-phosphoribosyl)-5-[(5- phosphoribosylamino)methylideneamino]imidazole-4- carboxamide isomerase n=1 Tax=Paraflavitalea sp. CAU 1676 TaxID=3032598 RepID=UPI0023D9EA3C|nr:1-(5-phosphoribosyl)-5-[(5-phosphoribosylamino)methylideneamino]imidazole-4-carboxamide isomerase [Paraflavitalea sp. CAU 1676]MDF2190247.1 1-(5-phosphoribosyl)-5-[(5-phosphoribosylamino)methylideneamino]imidazole-4-carboxamide isomerase [Paraflavitalea sp. CAU 1676]
MEIKNVPLPDVWHMRQAVMYPSESIDFVKLDLDEHGMHWGVYEKSELVSVISVFVEGKQVQFRKFATSVHHQGKGYGSTLLQYVIDWARHHGMHSMWCNARLNATSIYKKFGMQATGATWHKYGLEFIKMEKQLQRTMQIIPAIDIIDGKCVRLTQGDYERKKIYNEHPLEVALEFQDAGLKRLHLVDLDGAKAGAVKNWKVLETIAAKTSMVIDFGGGIKTDKDVNIVFNSGAALATVGSIAVKNEQEFVKWLLTYGADKFLLGADVKDEKIAVAGWLETTDVWIYDFIQKYIGHGVQQLFCTDVSKDGLLQGPSIDLYKNIITKFPDLHFIASGGVSNMDDVLELKAIGCSGVIIGKAIYEGRITIKDLATL